MLFWTTYFIIIHLWSNVFSAISLDQGPYINYTFVSGVSYYINQNVFMRGNIEISVNTEIIFVTNSTLQINGTLISGCDGSVDTSLITTPGTYSVSTLHPINISGASAGFGRIEIIGSSAKFCNTKFSSMDIAIKYVSNTSQELIIDNCQFSDITSTFWIDLNILYYITDTIISDVTYINYIGSGTVVYIIILLLIIFIHFIKDITQSQ